jgi:hypothetical protein
MPKYKLILTVQDSYGMTKEIEAGIVDAAEYELTDTELKNVVKRLPLDNFVSKSELPEDLNTELELADTINKTVKYSSFKFKGDSK